MGGWGIRRFHNDICMFSNPTEMANRRKHMYCPKIYSSLGIHINILKLLPKNGEQVGEATWPEGATNNINRTQICRTPEYFFSSNHSEQAANCTAFCTRTYYSESIIVCCNTNTNYENNYETSTETNITHQHQHQQQYLSLIHI